MTVVAFRVVCLLMGAIINQPVVGINMELWRRYCPSNKYCTLETANSRNDTNTAVTKSCCSNCSCDEKCWLFDNCCPDVLHEKPDNLQKAACVNPVINNFYYHEMLNNDHYLIVNVCPRDYDVTQRDVIERCLGTVKDDTDFDGIIPVMDDEGRLYRNKYCALCHGVLNFERWDLALVRCQSDMMSKTILGSRYVPTILDNCMIHAVPTENMMRERILQRCDQNYLSSCPIGENGGRSDIRSECFNGPKIPFLSTHGEIFLRFYKNVFCYMCDHDDTLTNNCNTTDKDFPGKYLFSAPRIMLLDMSIIHDFRDKSDMTSLPECDDTEIYDYVKDKCHRLYCPQFYILSHGRCLKMGTLYEYGVQLQIHYQPVDDIKVDVTHPDDGKALQNTLLKDYELEECNVTFFNIIGFIDVNDDRLASVRVYIELLFDKVCPMDDTIILIKRKLSKNNITLEYGHMQINLVGGLSFNMESEAYERNHLRMIRFIHSLGKVLVITSSKQIQIKSLYGFFLCPYFVINVDEYKSIMRETVERNMSITLQQYTRMREGIYALTNHTFAVCVDAYFELYKGNWAQSVVSNSLTLLVVTASIYLNLVPHA